MSKLEEFWFLKVDEMAPVKLFDDVFYYGCVSVYIYIYSKQSVLA